MKQKISALIDGELEARELRDVCQSLRKDAALRGLCNTYALIGDALRDEPYLATDIARGVHDLLAREPVILAPGAMPVVRDSQSGLRWMRPALAMAATVAGVSVVAWLGLQNSATPDKNFVAANGIEQKPLMVASVGNGAPSLDMQEYLIAHQIQSGSMFLNGDTQHIRTVSLSEASVRQ